VFDRDPEEAIKWLTLAAEQDVDRAQFDLASCYSNGIGVPADTAKGLQWLRRASKSARKTIEVCTSFICNILHFNHLIFSIDVSVFAGFDECCHIK
jgi:hypothetical protein